MELPRQAPLPPDPDPVFDRYARRVTERLDVPVALVSLVDTEGQVFPGAEGLPEPWASERSTPLTHSFCQHVVTAGLPLVVENANDDGRVRENAAILDLGVIAYAGMPLRVGERVFGSLCAIDHKPRRWTPEELAQLTEIAASCADELAGRLS